MKQYLGLGIGLIAGTLIGAAAISGLHAQAKAPVYLITEIDVSNPDAYGKEFAPKAQATIKAAGAKFILIGGAGGAGAKPITAMMPNKVRRWIRSEACLKRIRERIPSPLPAAAIIAMGIVIKSW